MESDLQLGRFSGVLLPRTIFVLRIKPSGVANDHGSGPRGWDKTSFICKFLLSAMTII